ncbi:MAG: hypothetical protein FJX66_00360 [Alphaproteobacteria bacterium]|nr:hypothetical protein [Alphaproteobacteria bacterium]
MNQRAFDRALLMAVAAAILALLIYGVASLWVAAGAEPPAAIDPLGGAATDQAASAVVLRS